MNKLETPMDYMHEANRSLNMEEWDRATAYAVAGCLSLLIGAAKAMTTLGPGQ